MLTDEELESGSKVLAEICRNSGAADEEVLIAPEGFGFVLLKLNILIPLSIVASALYYESSRKAISRLIWYEVLEIGKCRAGHIGDIQEIESMLDYDLPYLPPLSLN